MGKQNKTLALSVLMMPDMAHFTGHGLGGASLQLPDPVAHGRNHRRANPQKGDRRLVSRLFAQQDNHITHPIDGAWAQAAYPNGEASVRLGPHHRCATT
ncbi:MAG: hypothetical protein ACLFRJ_02270 [Ectothiorhodospira sp.]